MSAVTRTDSAAWCQKGATVNVTINWTGADIITIAGHVNCTTNPTGAQLSAAGPLTITVTPTNEGTFSFTATGAVNTVLTVSLGCWSITGVTPATATVEQGGSQTVSWVEGKGGLTWPAVDSYVSGDDAEAGDVVTIDASGTPFTIPIDPIYVAGTWFVYIRYNEGVELRVDSVFSLLPAHPTLSTAVANGSTQIDITWVNNATLGAGGGQNRIQASTDNFSSHTDFTATAAATSKSLTGLTPGAWKVRMYVHDTDSNTDSGYSGSLSVTLLDPDVIAPVLASASIPAAGTTVVLSFTEVDSPPLLPASSITGFSVKVDGTAVTVSNASRTASTQITLVLALPIPQTSRATVAYASGNVTDSASSPNSLAAFGSTSITNSSTQLRTGGVMTNMRIAAAMGMGR